MNAFEYAAPTTKEQAVSLLSIRWGETEILAGGTDLHPTPPSCRTDVVSASLAKVLKAMIPLMLLILR